MTVDLQIRDLVVEYSSGGYAVRPIDGREVQLGPGRQHQLRELEAEEHGSGRRDAQLPDSRAIGRRVPGTEIVEALIDRQRNRDSGRNPHIFQVPVLCQEGGYVGRRELQGT